jgi:hypothetical protein
MLQPAGAVVSEGAIATPCPRPHLGWHDRKAGLLAQLGDGGRHVRLTGLQSAAWQLPPHTKLWVVQVTGVKEKQLLSAVDGD